LLSGNPVFKAKTLIQKAWSAVEPFTELTAPEKEYLQRIEEGILRPEILFPDNPGDSAKFAVHPAILWKVANVRAHLKDREKL